MKNLSRAEFFLGGDDAEMRRIAEVLRNAGHEFFDAGLDWGAKVSAYSTSIQTCSADGFTPVLVELAIDIDLPQGTIVIDHHGVRAGEPPALIQVLTLLGITPTRRDRLIGAFDAGYVYGLQAVGATVDEIAEMLGLGMAEGRSLRDMILTAEKENAEVVDESIRAIGAMEWVGDMIVVRPAHSKSATVADRLLGLQPMQNILILSGDGEVNYYGTGDTVRALNKKFPDSSKCWSGGAGLISYTPESRAFWEFDGGHVPTNAFFGGYISHEDVLAFLTERFGKK